MRTSICLVLLASLGCDNEARFDPGLPPAGADLRPHGLTDMVSSSAPADLRPHDWADMVSSSKSAGCGVEALPGVATRTLDVQGITRSYLVVVPAGYDRDRAYPVVFGWHGLTWNASAFRTSIDLEGAAAGEAIFVYPQGLETAGLPADAAGGVTGLGWDWRAAGRDVALFDALVEELGGSLCIDRERLFSYGRSHGGFFTHALACFRGNVLRGAADAIGGRPGTIDQDLCQRAVPVWITHNVDDATVPITLAEAARELWRSVNQCSAESMVTTPTPCVRYACGQGTRVDWCANATGGHAPAGYTGQAIWAFFSAL